jgi:hypothetical protein
MHTPTIAYTRIEPSPIEAVMDAFVYGAMGMTPAEALERLDEPKDHMPPEVAEYVDDLMRWVIELHREDGYQPSHTPERLSA